MPQPKDELFLGYQTNFPGVVLPSNMLGVPIKVPVFHMLIAGQTQMSGKTTTVKALIEQAKNLGYKILLFDTKTQLSEFQGVGQEIPIPLRQTMDSLTILGLLESIMGRKLSDKYATLIKVTENAKDFGDVLTNCEALMEDTKSGWVHDAALQLRDLLQRLIRQTEGKNTVTELQLPYEVNRISLNDFDLEGQQMIIKTAFEDALKFPKLIIFIDEANKYLPQKYRSACDRAIFYYVTQGAITKNFLWIATQYLATTQKDVMKAMDVRLLGRQSHVTECDHTIEYIPKVGLAQNIKVDHIMQLKVGHFVAVGNNSVTCVYVCPPDADTNDCRLVAMGKLDPKDVNFRFTIVGTFDDIATAKATLKDQKIKTTVQEKLTVNSESIAIDNPRLETIEVNLPPTAEERIKNIENSIETIRKTMKNKTSVTGPDPNLAPPAAATQPPTPIVEQTNQEIKVTEIHTKITVNPEVIKLPAITTKDNRGKILMLAKENFFSSLHPLREVVAAFENHSWTSDTKQIQYELGKLVDDQILAVKISSKEKNYKLGAYIEFTEAA